jgi:hypothetical protein
MLIEDHATFVERGGDGAMMAELVRVGFLTTSNVDVGGATLITFLCELGGGCLRDVKVHLHTMVVD